MNHMARCWQLVVVALLVSLAVPGCRGCFQSEEDAAAKKDDEKKKKPTPDFEAGRLQILLRDEGGARNLVKAGHWMTAAQQMKANNFDFHAELESAATDRSREPFLVSDTAFRLSLFRPVVLPKGQTRELETTFFIPDSPPTGQLASPGTVWLRNTLRARRGGREVYAADEPTTMMPAYQYFFLVLAAEPDRYAYLRRLDSIVPPVVGEGNLAEPAMHYRVVLVQADRRAPLPSQPLAWTPIAYVLWDGLPPNRLTPDQQQALLDWLHWGGQIIVSGPNSLDVLRGSFLEPYLPALAAEAVQLQPTDFAPLNQGWSLEHSRTKVRASLNLPPHKTLVGVRLQPHPEAAPLPATGDLVWERRAGAGRIVVTAFSLADRPVVNWGSFDSFFNACLLRRPARVFRLSPEAEPDAQWAQFPGSGPMQDGRLVTGLRYFTRDATAASVVQNTASNAASNVAALTSPPAPPPPAQVVGSGQAQAAAWSDTSAASEAARQTLREAAGIVIPESRFVFRVLVVYLVVLVPVNWFVFRLLGRVEWAWLAAPVIAIAGAVVVVRLAQLDIGFARSRTEVAVLEGHAGYPSAHLTRYTAVYTSLATAYDFAFEDDSALAMPFPHRVPYAPGLREPINHVRFRRDRQIVLSGFQVASNSTGLVHSEQMLDLGGSCRLAGQEASGWSLSNGTTLSLEDAGVLARRLAGAWELAWVGSLPAAATRALKFRPAASADAYLAGASPEGRQGLQRLLELACRDPSQRAGDLRLIAWTAQPLPGLSIRPQASQESTRTLVLIQLRRGALPAPQPDQNLKADLAGQTGAEMENAAERAKAEDAPP